MPSNDELAALRAQFPGLATAEAYFNSAYTALVPEAVLKAAREAAVARWSRGADDVERARARVARFLNAEPEEIRFVSGTTAGLALVARQLRLSPFDRVVMSAAEHNANRAPWGRSRTEMARVDADGCVAWGELEARLPGARVLAIAHAGNVTGEIAPLARLAASARRESAWVVVDAAQSAPHMALNPRALGADVLVFSGHKAWGLGGLGVLWARREVAEALGLDQAPPEGGLPYEALEGLAEALTNLATSRTPALEDHKRQLVQRLDQGLRALPGARVLGPRELDRRIPLISLAGPVPAADLAEGLLARGIVVRAGMHRAEPLHASLGLPGTLRISAQTYNTLEEADRLLEAMSALWRG